MSKRIIITFITIYIILLGLKYEVKAENSLIEEDTIVEEVKEESTKVEAVEVEKKQPIEDGYYQIATFLDKNKVIDVSAASLDNKANIQIWGNVDAKQQKFKITYGNDGYYTIECVNSKKVLDVSWGVAKSGTNVWQHESNGTTAQKWIIKKNSDETYNIISALDETLQLDVENSSTKNGANIRICTTNNSKNQKFLFTKTDVVVPTKTIKNGTYKISMIANDNKVLDVSAASKENNANIQIWDYVDVNQQKFKLTCDKNGYYTIENVNSKKVLDVSWGVAKSGTNVWQHESNGTTAQKWIIKKNSDSTYSIISALDDNLQLDVTNSNTSNGTNVRIYTKNNGNSQKFLFTEVEAIIPEKTISDGTYKITMASNENYVIDISAASKENKANVQIWKYANVLQQKYKITYNGDGYYTIQNINSKKVLDVANGSAVSGVNVWQYESNGTDAQKWIIRKNKDGSYNINSALNYKLQLDVVNGNALNGTNVRIYNANTSNSQKFNFTKVTAIECESGTYGSSGLKVKGDSRGQNLKYYKIGNGPNVFFGTFAVHGWEDNFSYDGQELTKIAENFKNKLVDMQDEAIANKWTIYIFPSVNPDGEYHGYSHNGPGRTTLYSAAPKNKGIDINRGWSTSYAKATNDRNYNGTEPFQAYEARALRDFLLNHKSKNGQTVLVDLHGWLNETLGDDGIGAYYRNTLGMSKHISSYGKGYLINWAKNNLGFNGKTARSALIELPDAKSSNQVSSWGLSDKYINATINMLRGI